MDRGTTVKAVKGWLQSEVTELVEELAVVAVDRRAHATLYPERHLQEEVGHDGEVDQGQSDESRWMAQGLRSADGRRRARLATVAALARV